MNNKNNVDSNIIKKLLLLIKLYNNIIYNKYYI